MAKRRTIQGTLIYSYFYLIMVPKFDKFYFQSDEALLQNLCELLKL